MSRDSRRIPLWRRVVLGILERLKRVGVTLHPFLTVLEGESGPAQGASGDARHTFRFGFLTEADIDDLVRLEPGVEAAPLREWFRQGRLCFGAKEGRRLIAKMWCDLEAFHYPPNYRRLESDEAYLYAAYADPDYRGQNLVPLMRVRGYAALRELGRERFYSYTDYFNASARRFKAKLGARNEALRLYIELFGFWRKTLTLRRYPSA
jgi:hypothetical protein